MTPSSTTDTFMPFESILAPIIPGACCVMPLGTGSDMAWIKLRSGTSQLPISQQADRTFQIVLELALAVVRRKLWAVG
jgi:hypothetical protein